MNETCRFCKAEAIDPRDHFCLEMVAAMPKGERIGRRVVAVGAAEKARAKEIMAYADAHIYVPGKTPVPGTLPEHAMIVPFGIRAVFSITVASDGAHYRHLSLSLVDAPDRVVAPEVTLMIAKELFAFEGLFPDWQGFSDRPEARPQVVNLAYAIKHEGA